MGRIALPGFVAITLAACNAISGASGLGICDDCADASGPDVVTPPPGAPPPPTPGSSDAAGDSAIFLGDAGVDGPRADADADAGTDASPLIGCQGALACERVAFVTSASYTGDLGGIAGADAKCQAAANASAI